MWFLMDLGKIIECREERENTPRRFNASMRNGSWSSRVRKRRDSESTCEGLASPHFPCFPSSARQGATSARVASHTRDLHSSGALSLPFTRSQDTRVALTCTEYVLCGIEDGAVAFVASGLISRPLLIRYVTPEESQ